MQIITQQLSTEEMRNEESKESKGSVYKQTNIGVV